MLIEHLFILLKMVIDAIMGSVPFDVRKAQEVQEDAGMDLFSTTERGHIQLPKQYKDAGGKVLLGSDAYTPVTPDCGPNAK
jgi:hypothetical protein